jgi:tetratricopeptide (TPR) repeat protein
MRMHKAVAVLLLAGGFLCRGQNTPVANQGVDHATAYYHYALGHMYAEMAGSYGARGNDYVNQAIQNYKAAIKADPQTSMLAEELSDLYIATGRLREAQNDAEEALKQNPNDVAARRMLARIFMRQIGDSQRNRIDETMLKRTIEQFQKVTELDPKDADAWLILGRLHKVAQNSVESEKAYKKALEIEPDNEDALNGLALVYADLGNTKEAADLLKKAAEKRPTVRSLQTLAAAYEQMREFGLAAEALKRALEMEPPNADELRNELAQDLLFADRFEEARQLYQGLVDQEPGNAQAWLRLSQVYLRQREFGKAREASDKARGIEPNNVEVRYNEVNILKAEGRTQDAVQAIKEILSSTAKRSYNQAERGTRVSLLERLAIMQRDADQIADAVATFRSIAELDPDSAARASAEIVETYRIGKDLAKADQEAQAAEKKWPTDRVVRLTRADLMAEMGKVNEAAADVKKLLDGKEDRDIYLKLADIYSKGKKFDDMAKAINEAEKLSATQSEKEGVWFMRGAMFERMKNIDAAEAEFKKVLAVTPDNPNALNYLGYMLADRNVRLPEALTYINKAVEQDPFNGAYLDSLGWVYFRMGRFDDAEKYLRQAVERTPHDPTMRDHFAEALAKTSKIREAVAQWEISLKEWQTSSPSELDSSEMGKVRSKLDSARTRLAREGGR